MKKLEELLKSPEIAEKFNISNKLVENFIDILRHSDVKYTQELHDNLFN